MRRRELIKVLGGAAIALPFAARAQKPAVPVIGYLGAAAEASNLPYTAEFLRGLKQMGFREGRNVTIDYRWAEGHFDRLPALAAELVRNQVAVIFANGGTPVVRAARGATASIPIVFSIGDDPVRLGLVSSINRPGGNVTGATVNFTHLGAKRWELLHEMVPKVAVAAVLVDPNSPGSVLEEQQIEEAARASLGAPSSRASATERALGRLSQPAQMNMPTPCLLQRLHFSLKTVSRSWRWRRGTPSPPSTSNGSSWLSAAL